MKDIFDKINVVEALVVVFAGISLIAGIVAGRNEIALSLGTGLIAFLGVKSNGK